jgi:uncharacterized damage-inducible protein DinB
MAKLSQRLLWELEDIRQELVDIVRKLKPEEFDWHPRPDMKSPKDLLQEIGTMERVCMTVAAGRPKPDWEKAVTWSGNDAGTTLKDLEKIRAETVSFLKPATDEQLVRSIPVPESWRQYFKEPTVEPEELVRWVARHEYYHLGQLITYRWLLGYNPYKEGTTQ